VGRIGNAYGDSVGPRPIDLAIRKLADRQHGVVAHWQLIELGLTRQAIWRRGGKGTLIRIHPGVYAVGHTVERCGYPPEWGFRVSRIPNVR
jgi:hypothetical protein